MKKNKVSRGDKFEFVFYINDNIIIQWYFDVPDYNTDFPDSLELKDLMDEVMGMNNGDLGQLGIIPDSFKEQSMKSTWDDFYRPYLVQNPNDIRGNSLFNYEQLFTLKLKVNKKTIGTSAFKGNYFPSSVRKSVDINPIVDSIVDTMVHYMSKDELTIVSSEMNV